MNKKLDKKFAELFKKMKEQAKMAKKIVKQVIGMNEEDAVKLIEDKGLRARIVSRDGENFIVTMDFRTDRINLDIKNGKIVGAKIT